MPTCPSPASFAHALRLSHRAMEVVWFSDASARAEITALGTAALLRIRGDAASGEVVAQAQGGAPFVGIGLTVSGWLQLGRGPHALLSGPGEVFAWSGGQSGPFRASDGLQVLQFIVPSYEVRRRWPALAGGPVPRGLEVPAWAVAMAQAGADAIIERRAGWAPQESERAAAAVLNLLCGPTSDASVRRARRLQVAQVVAQVDAALDDAALGPSLLASRLDVSVRTLQALLARHQLTVGGLVRTRRLEHCRARLMEEGADARIGDIAARFGFCDPAHFSKVFKAAYGVAPRDFRRQGEKTISREPDKCHAAVGTSAAATAHPGDGRSC